MKNVIITGATSFVGVSVTEILLQNKIEVFAVVRPDSQNLGRLQKAPNLHIVELDMADISRLPTMRLPHIDVFYHFAWDGVRTPARDDVSLQERNYIASMEAIKTAAALGCGSFIGAGSQAEYGLLAGEIAENSLTNPITPYGKSKLKVCLDGQNYASKHAIRFIWPRIFSLYGTNDYENTLIMSCLKKMRQHVAIDLTACTQMWDFLHVSDAARAFYLLGMSSSTSGIYHVASGCSYPLRDIVQQIKQISKSKSLLNFCKVPYPREGATSFEPVVNRLKQELSWSPQVTFQDGILDILYHMERQSE